MEAAKDRLPKLIAIILGILVSYRILKFAFLRLIIPRLLQHGTAYLASSMTMVDESGPDQTRRCWQRAQNYGHNILRKLAPIMFQRIDRKIILPTTDQLRNAAKEEKKKLFNDVMRGSVTRVFVAIYSVSMMILSMRLSNSLLERYNYLDSLSDEEPMDEKTQQRYLEINQHIQGKGLEDLISAISVEVDLEMENYHLEKKYTTQQIVDLYNSIKRRIDAPDGKHRPLFPFLIPEDDPSEQDEQLLCLLNETRDIVESEHFQGILYKTLEHATNDVTKSIQTQMDTLLNSQKNGQVPTSLPMPQIIPILRRQFDRISLDTEERDGFSFAESQWRQPELEDYSFFIFSSAYDDNEIHQM
eukprot:TRINITY_DN4875_c0_g1_i1.p1 TRINITY_DN4875_c0_g1~~TRINITY_DN4875_c0_g1_i1.p1  ORF type:complete len:358 (+),score=95.40 TRINITY_DN4875_c0_g1_i1:57-1130(+)